MLTISSLKNLAKKPFTSKARKHDAYVKATLQMQASSPTLNFGSVTIVNPERTRIKGQRRKIREIRDFSSFLSVRVGKQSPRKQGRLQSKDSMNKLLQRASQQEGQSWETSESDAILSSAIFLPWFTVDPSSPLIERYHDENAVRRDGGGFEPMDNYQMTCFGARPPILEWRNVQPGLMILFAKLRQPIVDATLCNCRQHWDMNITNKASQKSVLGGSNTNEDIHRLRSLRVMAPKTSLSIASSTSSTMSTFTSFFDAVIDKLGSRRQRKTTRTQRKQQKCLNPDVESGPTIIPSHESDPQDELQVDRNATTNPVRNSRFHQWNPTKRRKHRELNKQLTKRCSETVSPPEKTHAELEYSNFHGRAGWRRSGSENDPILDSAEFMPWFNRNPQSPLIEKYRDENEERRGKT
ncbi:hypothetical protein B0H34DRAFT_672102 [Crassisporium funariophilum]|nr:hypothetical protein B0H34DRAFT_672102 [Crassisporium funariophilum]